MKKYIGYVKHIIKQYEFIFSKREKTVFAFLILLLVIGSLLETAAVYLMLPFMYAMVDPAQLMENAIMGRIYDTLHLSSISQMIISMAVFIAAIYIVKGCYSLIVTRIQYSYLAKSRITFSEKIFRCIYNKDYSYFLNKNTAEIQKIFLNDVNRLYSWLSSIFQLIYEICTSVFILAALLTVDLKLVLFAIAMISFVTVLVNGFIIKKIRRMSMQIQKAVQDLYRWIAQATGAVKEIKVSNKQNYFVEGYGKYISDYVMAENKNQVYGNIPRVMIETVCMASIFLYLAGMIASGADLNSTLPLLGTFALAAVRIIPIVGRMSAAVNAITFNQLGVDSVCDTLKSNDVAGANAEDDEIIEEAESGSIEIKNVISIEHVSFKYDDSDTWIYRDISFTIPRGSSAALIGPTGAGKTTLADIILGVHRPLEGGVYVDGKSICKYKAWWAKCIGYIPQFIYLCDDTIRNNIAFGVPMEEIDDRRIEECMKEAQILDFVRELPQYLDTMVGENGIRLSGGQRQRIGIARALYHDPPFLVMDEATSALDNETEAAIVEAINNLSGKKTMLVIAHRMTTIKHCDIIYKIENGNVVRERNR